MKYAVFIPARDEERGIAITLQAIVAQKLQASYVLVLNDHSADNTKEVVKSFQEKYAYIECIDYPENGNYKLGGKIVRMMKYAYSKVISKFPDIDFFIKMDADIEFDKQFFQQIFSNGFNSNMGIMSGTPFYERSNQKVFINSPKWHTNGDFKIYNSTFIKQIENFPEDLGWDCADNIIARENGFNTEVYRGIYYRQNRPIGRDSILKGKKRQGKGAYKLNYHPLFLSLKLAYDLVKKPYILGSIKYFQGYFGAFLSRDEKILSKHQNKMLRSLMWNGLKDRLVQNEFMQSEKE